MRIKTITFKLIIMNSPTKMTKIETALILSIYGVSFSYFCFTCNLVFHLLTK